MYTIRPWLYIGGIRETREEWLLQQEGINAVLQLTERIAYTGDISALFLFVDDGAPLPPEDIDRGVIFVREKALAGDNVLVACGMGVSRSVTFATAALKEIEEIGLLEAFRIVRAGNPTARPHPVLWQSLCDRYGENIPYLEVMRAMRTPPS